MAVKHGRTLAETIYVEQPQQQVSSAHRDVVVAKNASDK
jgi:hypothetical protein